MKAKISLTVLFTYFSIVLSAQIPNSSFESWSGNEMTSWVSTNGLTFLGNPQTIFKSSDAHSGSFACEMIAAHITSKPSGVFVPDYAGSIFLGKQSFTVSTWGFPYTFRPAKTEYWFKFIPNGIDTANGIFFLTKWDSIQGRRDTIAAAYTFHTTLDSVYSKAVTNFTYYSAATPDSAILGLASVALSCNHAGTKFVIDDLAFTGGNVGLTLNDKPEEFEISPNPSTGLINIKFKTSFPSVSLKLYTLEGREVLSENMFDVSETKLLTHQLRGIYILRVRSDEGEFFKKVLID